MINWEYLVTLFFAFTFVFVIFLTAGFYVGYRKDQWIKKQKPKQHPVNGRYFTRYLPDGLKGKYSQ